MIEAIEENLKKRLQHHFCEIGLSRNDKGLLPTNNSKDAYRSAHELQRKAKYMNNLLFVKNKYDGLIKFFASGDEVDVTKINLTIEPVKAATWQSDLFRLATLYWRVPVSVGYGRRMRFVVWDENNNKIFGIFGLGDAVFNLKVRDQLIGWNHKDRSEYLVNLMDAYVLGALPPYNMLLGGKAVACIIRTKEIVRMFDDKYGSTTGIISGKKKNAQLVMVTTSSALGRSSIYNRLILQGIKYFNSIGYTSGWGHFHIPDDLFEEMRSYLKAIGDPYANNHSFGQGPNWKLRTVRKVFGLLGLDENSARHGLLREVFMCKMANNSIDILKGIQMDPDYGELLTVAEVSELAKQRWIMPRSQRRPEYLQWKREMMRNEFVSSETGG